MSLWWTGAASTAGPSLRADDEDADRLRRVVRIGVRRSARCNDRRSWQRCEARVAKAKRNRSFEDVIARVQRGVHMQGRTRPVGCERVLKNCERVPVVLEVHLTLLHICRCSYDERALRKTTRRDNSSCEPPTGAAARPCLDVTGRLQGQEVRLTPPSACGEQASWPKAVRGRRPSSRRAVRLVGDLRFPAREEACRPHSSAAGEERHSLYERRATHRKDPAAGVGAPDASRLPRDHQRARAKSPRDRAASAGAVVRGDREPSQ